MKNVKRKHIRGLKRIMPFLSKRQCTYIIEWAEIERNNAPTGEDDRPDDIIGDPLLILHWNEVAFAAHTAANPVQTKALLVGGLVARGGVELCNSGMIFRFDTEDALISTVADTLNAYPWAKHTAARVLVGDLAEDYIVRADRKNVEEVTRLRLFSV